MWPDTAVAMQESHGERGKNKSHLQGRFKMAVPCQAGKGEVKVEMLYPQQHDPAGRNPILKTEQRMASMAAPCEKSTPSLRCLESPHSPQGHPVIPETSSSARGISPL